MNAAEIIGYSHRKNKFGWCITPYTNINYKMDHRPNVKSKTFRIKHRRKFSDSELGKDLDMAPKIWPMKLKKLINSTASTIKSPFRGWIDKPQPERKYFPTIYLMKNLYPKYKKNFQNIIGKQTIQFLMEQRIWTDTWPKKVYWWQVST